jgi:MYXO-CTERM domain-containing protein
VHNHRRGGIVVATVLGLAVATVGVVGSAAAAGNTLRIEPATVAVAKDATFTVTVVQETEVATSGAQATITFDPALLQITSVTPGAPYASASLLLAADEAAIVAANKSGELKTAAAAFFPPGSVPAGEADFLVVEFRAISCGTVDLGLPVGPLDASLIDGREATFGDELTVATTGATVSTCAAGGDVPASPTPPAGSAASPTATTTDSGPPWPVIGLIGLAVAIAAGGLWLARRRARAE